MTIADGDFLWEGSDDFKNASNTAAFIWRSAARSNPGM